MVILISNGRLERRRNLSLEHIIPVDIVEEGVRADLDPGSSLSTETLLRVFDEEATDECAGAVLDDGVDGRLCCNHRFERLVVVSTSV